MNALIYNAAVVIGLVLVGVGIGLRSVPDALTVVGALVLILTMYGAHVATARRG